VAYKHVNETIPPPSAVLPELPQVLDALVALGTSRDPQLRPADAGQFLQAVGQVRKGQPIPWPPRPQQPPTPDPRAMPPGAAPAPFGQEGFRGIAGEPGISPSAQLAPIQPAALLTEPVAGMYRPSNQTLIVGRHSADGGEPAPREPRLQRWLFSRRLVYLLVAVVVVALIGGLGWWQLVGRYTKVPQVTGLSAAAAGAELRDMGFTVKTGAPRLDNRLAKGEVVATLPAAAARVRKGSSIEIISSAGPRMIAVPQVSGQPLANAQAALRRAGLTPGAVTSQVSATIAAGIVISTNPAAGASWPQPQPVKITVSGGPPLPNFVGQQQSVAEGWAAANGISLNEQPAANSTQPQGTIIRQSPAANTPATKGEVVTIYISPGPPQVKIPNVDGEGVLAAYRQLRALGFQVTSQQSGPFGKNVFNYSPSGQAPKGSTITVYWGLPSIGGGG